MSLSLSYFSALGKKSCPENEIFFIFRAILSRKAKDLIYLILSMCYLIFLRPDAIETTANTIIIKAGTALALPAA